MNYLAILSFTLLFLQIDCRSHKKFEPEETCTTELKLSRHKMKTVVNEINTSENNVKYWSFFRCVFEKRGVMKENGKIDESGLETFLQQIFFERSKVTDDQKVIVHQIFEDCKDIVQDLPGSTAIRLKNCIAKNIKEYDTDL